MTLSAFSTALSGLGLLWWCAQGGWGVWTASAYGYAILAGSIVGLAGFFLGLFVNAPTAKKMSDLAWAMQSAGRPPSPDQLAEMGRLQQRMHGAALTSAVLLSLTVILMGAARAL